MATALATLMALPTAPLPFSPSPLYRMTRLERALGPASPQLFIKRDDLLPFARGGNKVRKMLVVAAEASRQGADTLVTCGTISSNHARVTAATAAALGWRAVLVLSGAPPDPPRGNLWLDRLFGAQVRFVATPGERDAAMAQVADEERAAGRRPFVIPTGASTPLGAMAIARAVSEVLSAGVRPNVIVHAGSSGGTEAGLIAGCAILGLDAQVIAVSIDTPAADLERIVRGLLEGVAADLGARASTVGADRRIAIDDTQIGGGYGQPTPASEEAIVLLARHEGVVLDSTYTAKAMAGLIAAVRARRFDPGQSILFWQTGGWHGD